LRRFCPVLLAIPLSLTPQSNLWGLIVSAGPIAKAVLLILFVCSVLSWAVILYKYVVLRRMETENRRFLGLFSKTDDLDEVRKMAIRLGEGPLSTLFTEGCRHMSFDGAPEEDQRWGKLKGLERLLRSGAQDEMVHQERYLPFLATIGGVTPFIGLFGTVWGIIDAFAEIGRQGTANIAAVAPGVAEALVTTAAGLATAIPAVIAYNFFVGKLRRMETQMDVFSAELVSLVEERWFKEKEKVSP
jgi:biopolymer transport protein TolQ